MSMCLCLSVFKRLLLLVLWVCVLSVIVTLPGLTHFPLGSYLQLSYGVRCFEFYVDIHLLYCEMEM